MDLRHLLSALFDAGINSLFVEGGGTLIRGFYSAGLLDSLVVYVSSLFAGSGRAPFSGMVDHMAVDGGFRMIEVKDLGGTALLYFLHQRADEEELLEKTLRLTRGSIEKDVFQELGE